MKRGAQTLSLEVFVALAFAAVMILFMLSYVNAQSNSTGYFQKFYVKDLSLMAEVVTAAPGNVVVTYDNLRDSELTYEFEEGIVRVTTGSITKSLAYGLYPGLSVTPNKILGARFLTFIKTGDQFFVKEDIGYLQGCSLNQDTIHTPSFW